VAKKRGPGGRSTWAQQKARELTKRKKRWAGTYTLPYESFGRGTFWDKMDRNYLVRCLVCGRLATRLDAECNLPHASVEHAGVCDYCTGSAPTTVKSFERLGN